MKPAVVKILDSQNGQQGTGFIVSKKGLVVTADHNVSNASNTKVAFMMNQKGIVTKLNLGIRFMM